MVIPTLIFHFKCFFITCFIILSLYIAPPCIQSKVKIELESEEKEKEVQDSLERLHRNFSKLMDVVQSGLDHKLKHQQLQLEKLTRWIKRELKSAKELKDLNECTNLEELFEKVDPYFDFLECDLIVNMSEEFLKDEKFGEDKMIHSELKNHMKEADTLRCLSTVKDLMAKLTKICDQHHPNMPMIHIKLHIQNAWYRTTIARLRLLIEHLLPYKSGQSILKYIDFEQGSIIIKYNVLESQANCLIAFAQGKPQFMHLVGVFHLVINDVTILKGKELINFTFDSALLEAAKVGHIEATQFLLELGANVDAALNEAKKAQHNNAVEFLSKRENLATPNTWLGKILHSLLSL